MGGKSFKMYIYKCIINYIRNLKELKVTYNNNQIIKYLETILSS